jgi:hypothetical protein
MFNAVSCVVNFYNTGAVTRDRRIATFATVTSVESISVFLTLENSPSFFARNQFNSARNLRVLKM